MDIRSQTLKFSFALAGHVHDQIKERSGGVDHGGDWSVQFGPRGGIKFQAVISGECWFAVDGVPEPVRLSAGDRHLLAAGLPSRLAIDRVLTPVDAQALLQTSLNGAVRTIGGGGGSCFSVGGLCRQACRDPAGRAPTHRAYPEGIGQSGHALVCRAPDTGVVRTPAWRRPDRAAARLYAADPGPSTPSG